MKTTFLIIIGIGVVTVSIFVSMTMINETYITNILTRDDLFSNDCDLIRGENDTFYVIEENCGFEPFKPIRPSASFFSLDTNQKLQEAMKIRNACIPVSGFDVDEIPGTLVIYFTDENASKYSDHVDNIIEMPYVIKTTERPSMSPDDPWLNASCSIQNLFD